MVEIQGESIFHFFQLNKGRGHAELEWVKPPEYRPGDQILWLKIKIYTPKHWLMINRTKISSLPKIAKYASDKRKLLKCSANKNNTIFFQIRLQLLSMFVIWWSWGNTCPPFATNTAHDHRITKFHANWGHDANPMLI